MSKSVFLWMLIATLILPLGAEEIRETSIAWEDGLKPPYLLLDAQNQPAGIAVEMLNEIFKRAKIKVRHDVIPWKRCLYNLENQQVDVVPNSSYKEDRAKFACYTKALYQTHMVLFYLKSRYSKIPAIAHTDDLQSYRVGGILGFNYDHLGTKIKVDDGAKDRIALINKLRYNRIDLANDQLEVILYMAKEKSIDLTDIAYLPDPGAPLKDFYVLTVKNQKGLQLQEIIDKGIAELNKDGTAARIRSKYLEINSSE